jgi:hypothetical protein
MGRAYRPNGEKKNAYWILVRTQEGKKLLERPRRRWAILK